LSRNDHPNSSPGRIKGNEYFRSYLSLTKLSKRKNKDKLFFFPFVVRYGKASTRKLRLDYNQT
jgi:hypothetical protein